MRHSDQAKLEPFSAGHPEPRASARADSCKELAFGIGLRVARSSSAGPWAARCGCLSRVVPFALAVVIATSTLTGCAKPRGILFPVLAEPKVWPAPPDPPRIKLVGTLSGSGDLKAEQSATEVFKAALRGPRPPINLIGPHAVVLHKSGVLAVADGQGSSVHLLDLVNRTHVQVTGWGDERLAAPVGVAWLGDHLVVSDAQRHELIELDRTGAFVRSFGADELIRPVGVVYVGARDELYVVDGGAHCLVRFDRSGQVVGKFGTRGAQPGQFNFPTHLAVDRQGRLAVADTGNFRVQLLDLDGAPLAQFGSKGDGAGDFALPKGVAFDSEGHIYVVDAQFENVQVFDAQGRLLLAFGEEGAGLGEFSLPAGLAIDDADRIWVADSANRRIQVFAYVRNS